MSSRISKLTLAILLAATSVSAHARVDAAIRLDGVPDQLILPMLKGKNHQLTATVVGTKAESAWLAIGQNAQGMERVDLKPIDESTFAVNLAAKEVYTALKPFASSDAFYVFARTTNGDVIKSLPVRFAIARTLPEYFEFPYDEARLTIYQRTCKEIPSGHCELRVCLNDITAGQVGVRILGRKQDSVFEDRMVRLVDTTSMREGDVLTLPLRHGELALRLDRLVNVLIGHDFAEFTVMPRPRLESQRIDALLEKIESSAATFVRNDREYTGAQFATHLRAKHRHLGPKNPTLEEFIDQVATRSTETGKPYRIKLPGGDVMDVGTWLRGHAKSIANEESNKGDGST